jgi:hypothetical protein
VAPAFSHNASAGAAHFFLVFEVSQREREIVEADETYYGRVETPRAGIEFVGAAPALRRAASSALNCSSFFLGAI